MNMLLLVSSLIFFLFTNALQLYTQDGAKWKEIEGVFGRKGIVKDGYFKVSFPRSDLNVKVGDVTVAPGLALGGWFGFAPAGPNVMVMGDMVLTEAEVATVESKLIDEGIEITALHNHLLGETPSVKYLHIEGMGSPRELAEKLKAALMLTGTPMTPPASAMAAADWSQVESILGAKGDAKGSVIQFGFPRAETITDGGMEIPPLLGVANAINFQKVGDKVAATGDFVLTSDEVTPVVRALHNNGILVTAIHSHMLHDQPRLFMLHFWGYDSPEKVARGLRSALDKVHLKK